jgi:hypothetical protein
LGLVHPGLAVALSPAFFPSLLTVQGATETRTPTGAVVTGWGDVAGLVDLPCRIAPQGGQESRTQQQVLTQDVQTCVTPVHLPDVTTKHQAVVDGNAYDIVSVDYDGQNPPRLTRLTLKVVT